MKLSIQHLLMSWDWLKAKYHTTKPENWFVMLTPKNRIEQHIKERKEEYMSITENYKVSVKSKPYGANEDEDNGIIQVEITVNDKNIQNNLLDWKMVSVEDYEVQDDGSFHFYLITADNPATRGIIAALEQHGKLNTGNTDSDFYVATLIRIMSTFLWD